MVTFLSAKGDVECQMLVAGPLDHDRPPNAANELHPVANTVAGAKIALLDWGAIARDRYDPPKQLTFFISLALAVIAVVVRFMAYQGIQVPLFPTAGFLILLVGYLVLLAGNLFEGA
jgi:Na+/H+ antiporter NhaC